MIKILFKITIKHTFMYLLNNFFLCFVIENSYYIYEFDFVIVI